MGLDNIPHVYACRKQGTVIESPRLDKDGNPLTEEDGSVVMAIDCKATQEAGGCPYTKAFATSGLEGGAVYGIFGTDCWYRGKWGNWLLEDTGLYDETTGVSFYGALGDNSHKSPHECLILADAISNFLDDEPDWKASEGDADASDLAYAEWYLRWAAEECEGLDCWY